MITSKKYNFRNSNYKEPQRLVLPKDTHLPVSDIYCRGVHKFNSDFPNEILTAVTKAAQYHIRTKLLVPVIKSFKYNDLEVIPTLYDNIQQIPISEHAIVGSEYEVDLKSLDINILKKRQISGKLVAGHASYKYLYSGDLKPVVTTGAKENMFDTCIPLHVLKNTTSLKFLAVVEEHQVDSIRCVAPMFKSTFYTDKCMNAISDMNHNDPRNTYKLADRRAELDTLKGDEMYNVVVNLNGNHSLKSIISSATKYLIDFIRTLMISEVFDTSLTETAVSNGTFEYRYTIQAQNSTGYIMLLRHLNNGYQFQEFRQFLAVIGTDDPFSRNYHLDMRTKLDLENTKQLILHGMNQLIQLLESFKI
jgi:hypothetical protein